MGDVWVRIGVDWPARGEDDADNVIARIVIEEFGHGVLDGLMEVQEVGFGEDFAAVGTRVDVIAEGEEVVLLGGGDIGVGRWVAGRIGGGYWVETGDDHGGVVA